MDRQKLIVLAGVGVGFAACVWLITFLYGSAVQWFPLAFFCVLTFAAEALPVPLPKGNGTVSVSAAVVIAAVILLGPLQGLVVATVGTLRWMELRGKARPLSVVFNRLQLGVSGGLSGLAYYWLAPSAHLTTGDLIPFVVAGFVYPFVNLTLVTWYLAAGSESSFTDTWLSNLKWMAPNYIALVPMAFLIGVTYQQVGPIAVLFFFLPLMLARMAFQRYIDMRQLFNESVHTLTSALEVKDYYTKGHSERVAELAVDIARQLGWGEDKLEDLRVVGLLHDIGKIGIPDRILKKPGRYTDQEYENMQRHPVIGGRMLDELGLMKDAWTWVYHHHEWYNGEGYPSGMSGEEIPFGARIIAVADAFDAMVSQRIYRDGVVSYTDALAELERYAGRQFDPVVVEAFRAYMKTDEAQSRISERLEMTAHGRKLSEHDVAASWSQGSSEGLQGG